MFSKIYDILGESLNVLSDRQNIIASNVANANTPGYKSKELNFKDVMKNLVPSPSSLPMEATSRKDLSYENIYNAAERDGSGFIKSFIKNQKDESVPALDGNTVEIGREMSNMTSNAIRFQAVAGLLSKKFATLTYAITQANP
ncbi:flagellar basal body rod protein FlgB [Candidatus Acidulodesulfobacterium sp. H_13]|uniref:flagellar basal body rod protein FlgB n=1 Tax=Candidatus Acidulodesulfobacterium sp. H_13 TaxID=3395470 RepID=UPI003AF594F6